MERYGIVGSAAATDERDQQDEARDRDPQLQPCGGRRAAPRAPIGPPVRWVPS